MARTKIFYNNRTQAVRLSKELSFDDSVTEVEVRAEGVSRVITPAGGDWLDWWENGPKASPDFMADRDQPAEQERAW